MALKVLIVLVSVFSVSIALALVGGGDITFQGGKAGKVVFSHDSHVSAHFLSCTDCHSSPFTTKAAHKTVTMAQMAQGESCGACHNGKWAFSVKENCKLCHD